MWQLNDKYLCILYAIATNGKMYVVNYIWLAMLSCCKVRWKTVLFVLRKIGRRMFYATGVDKIRQNVAKIWDAVKFRNTLIKKIYILKQCTKGQTLYYQSRTQQIKPQ